jgi:23S rRNA pseudouridine1911/1915/1917 synthase
MTGEQLRILYEDNHLLAVDKPAGLLVQGDASGDATLLDMAKVYLKEAYRKPGNVFLGLVHRLDRPVSGVILLARTSKAASRLAAQFRAGSARKQYLAVIAKRMAEPAGELVAYLAASGDGQGVTRAAWGPFPGSREARLRYQVVEAAGDRSLVTIALLTGRRHQIRAQFALAGCPIWGDRKYGSTHRLAGRIALHAARLEITHPTSGQPVLIEAPLPTVGWPWPAP